MGKLGIFVLLVSVFVGYKIKTVLDPPRLPEKLKETWWGPGNPDSVKTIIKPFTINVSDEVLKDLQYRLDHHRPFTPPLEGIQQQYGMNTNLLEEIVDYWRMKYDWRKQEKYLNKFPQYTINIQGLDIHFIHIKPIVPQNIKKLPLLILHGWPGSVREFYDILPILTTPQEGRDFVFEVIVPHIPGYGFSKPAIRPGLSPDNIALVFKNMMYALGYQKFYIQGGDFGAIILRNLAVLYPEVVLGFHSNMCTVLTLKKYVKSLLASIFPSFPSWYVRPEHYDRVFPVKERFYDTIRESGYLHEQSTKPDTLGAAMNESPIGLAAYILEKFTTGTNKTWQNREDGGLLEYFTYDDLLDNIMIYWITNSATTSFRLYAETFNRAVTEKGILGQPIHVPTACSRYSNDFYTPDGMLKDIFLNLVHLTDFDGGHFAAFQLPKIFAKDVYDAVEKFEVINNN
ncbi:juvenile hormone epoxide hydrolase 2-like [Diorhabda carinulata]|uniref:juvenile hormone epoxide hydrolase 2-like n=1 Tax=Diorhabda carinulata TaxID=1163345 RepID=UPI0025A1F20F|nr:juvenile hormone epoxide hydrolase 2-like [Diorhabda carinulata]